MFSLTTLFFIQLFFKRAPRSKCTFFYLSLTNTKIKQVSSFHFQCHFVRTIQDCLCILLFTPYLLHVILRAAHNCLCIFLFFFSPCPIHIHTHHPCIWERKEGANSPGTNEKRRRRERRRRRRRNDYKVFLLSFSSSPGRHWALRLIGQR